MNVALAEAGAVGVLGLAAGGGRVYAQADQREIALARAGLDRADAQLALDALDLLADVQLPAVGVDVLPAQAQDLAAAHPVQEQQHERRIQRVGGGGLEEGDRFRG